MNYRKAYMAIITKALKEERSKKQDVYYEAHHILPKSLFPLWSKKKSNIVLLTAREHYICHMFATKIWPTKEMACAFMMMCSDCKNATMYKISRENYSKYYSGEGNPMYGRSAYKEMSDSEKEHYRKKLSESCKKVKRTDEWNNNISNSLKGKPKSELSIQKGIETKRINGTDRNFQTAGTLAHIGKHWFNNGKENILAFECPKGFSKGKIQKELDEATKAKVKLAQSNFGKGKHWFNNGNENFFGFDCPEGYVAGKLHKEYKKRQGSRKNLKENKDGD